MNRNTRSGRRVGGWDRRHVTVHRVHVFAPALGPGLQKLGRRRKVLLCPFGGSVMVGGVYAPESLLHTLLDSSAAPAPVPFREHGAESGLTQRQIEVLDLLSTGLSNKEIAAALDIEASTVKQHLHAIFRILGVDKRTQAASRILKGRGE